MTAILYASKFGAARECAGLLAEKLAGSKTFDLAKELPDLTPFGCIIVGSGVRMGKVYKPVAKLLARQAELLAAKKLAFYFCNTYDENFAAMLEKNLPGRLAIHASCISSFGGKPPFAKTTTAPWLKKDEVDRLVACVAAP